jgi:hypothetical protein
VELRVEQLLQALAAAANSGMMKLDLERLEFKEDGVHETDAVCGLTFELKPTTEVGTVRLGCDDAGWPQASLAVPAVVGRRLERGVRPHFESPVR